MPPLPPPLALVSPNRDGGGAGAAAEQVEALFREHYRALVVFAAHYTRDRGVAEEVVQEVFLRFWERCEREGPGEVTRSYLFSAVRYQTLTLLRHERVARRWSERATQELQWRGRDAAGDDPPVAALEAEDLTRAVRRAVAGLSEKTRVVFLLSREGGLTYAKIAEVLGISVKTVELHMTRALKTLRANLRGVTLGLAFLAAGMLATAMLARVALATVGIAGGG